MARLYQRKADALTGIMESEEETVAKHPKLREFIERFGRKNFIIIDG